MAQTQKIRILIADDHQMMLDGLQALLADEKNIQIVAQASNGIQVLDVLAFEKIDVAIIDIGMPQMNGYETVLHMKQKHPETKIIILSLHNEEKYIGKLLKAGVSGYIIKNRGSEELIKAIYQVAGGKPYFDDEVKEIALKAFQNKSAGPDKIVKFTKMEEKVLHLVADGLSAKEIAEKLFIGETTADTHKRNMLKKLDLPNSKMLMKYAIEKGYGSTPL